MTEEIKPKEKTYQVLWGMTVATYYKVKASSEDEAIERSGLDYDKDEEWAIDKWEEGYEGSACSYSTIEEVDDD